MYIACVFQCSWLAAILVSLQMTSGFLTANDQCFDVCTCSTQSWIVCTMRGLQSYPDFVFSVLPTEYIEIDLFDNRFTEIPFGIFRNVNFPPDFSNEMYLLMQNNQISRIHNGAFLGLENIPLQLNLGHNRLTSISREFTRLRRLYSLSIEGNPLTVPGIPDDVIRDMFHNDFQVISLSSYELLKKVMKYGQDRLYALYIYDINETRFDEGLFVKGQTKALNILAIYNSAFSDFSEVLCNLDLGDFSVNMCWNVNDTTLQGCSQNNTVTLEIQNCATTDALDPSAFFNAPLEGLKLSGHMNRVPRGLLSHWPYLATIYLTGDINGVQNDDFNHLTDLNHLVIVSDTITFLDNEAFNTNLKLQQLGFEGRGLLNNLPSSIKNLTLLTSLELPDMTCSCATMGALKGGNYSSMYVSGNCKNIPGKSIKTYLNKDITACP